jgi:uncharacterized protein (TIGR00730 family)
MTEPPKTLGQLVDEVLAERQGLPNQDLVRRLYRIASDISADEFDRLDLKILTASLRELQYALRAFRPYRMRKKATVFGSARTPKDHPDYLLAHELGEHLSSESWMVVTGGGPGIMRAAMEGAGPNHAFGVGIALPFEQKDDERFDEYIRVEMKYFFTRKVMLVKESHAFFAMPGGLGTLDEVFEVLTLIQTGKAQLAPVILVQDPRWDHYGPLMEYFRNVLVPSGYISPNDLSLVSLYEDAKAASDEAIGFYENYHSMRWVGDSLILRLHELPGNGDLSALRERFRDITTGETLVPTEPLPAEIADGDEISLPRLRVAFNRRDYARLRELIDALNGRSRPTWQRSIQ